MEKKAEMSAKEFSEVLREFSDWMEDFDFLFDSPEDGFVKRDYDGKTYTVRVSGLNYTDAQNIIEMGLEYGMNATIMEEL